MSLKDQDGAMPGPCTMRRTEKRQPELVSVVLPAFNEAAGIESAVVEIDATLQAVGLPYEIIVVDDGSTDRTYAAVEDLCLSNRRLRGVRLSRNFGKEAALLAGLRNAGGEVVVTMDADLQHPPGLIPEMLNLWREGTQVVHGVKRNRAPDTFLGRRFSRLFNRVFSATASVNIDLRDASDFKLLDRSAVNALVSRLPEKRRFYRGLAAWIGFRQQAIPFDVDTREAGEGKWSLIALIDLATTAIISYSSLPLRIVTLLGIVTHVFGIVVSLEALWSWYRGYAVSGFVTIIIAMLLLGSFTMISLGIIGEYIAKIYDEIKSRPAYLVESHCGFGRNDIDE